MIGVAGWQCNQKRLAKKQAGEVNAVSNHAWADPQVGQSGPSPDSIMAQPSRPSYHMLARNQISACPDASQRPVFTQP
jgi:hypothetical protein